jgi:hypothetical protein
VDREVESAFPRSCLLVTKLKATERNRREAGFLSRVTWVPLSELLLFPGEILPPKHEPINLPLPPFKVPRTQWPRVVQRVAQGESARLRLASNYCES